MTDLHSDRGASAERAEAAAIAPGQDERRHDLGPAMLRGLRQALVKQIEQGTEPEPGMHAESWLDGYREALIRCVLVIDQLILPEIAVAIYDETDRIWKASR